MHRASLDNNHICVLQATEKEPISDFEKCGNDIDAITDPSVIDSNKASSRARKSLIGANFFIECNRLEPLVGVYLLQYHGWDVLWVGYMSVAMNITMLVLQTPAGDFMDKTRHKKLVTAFAVSVAAVTTAAVAWTSNVYAVISIKVVEGIAATIFMPALMSLLLGVTPNREVPNTIALTETSNKLGTVLFTIATGVIAYFAYPNVSSIFYLLGAAGLIAAAFILFIPSSTISDKRARQARASIIEFSTISDKRVQRARSSLVEFGSDEETETGKSIESSDESSEEAEQKKPTHSRYRDLLTNRPTVMFALLTFLYHLSNAGIVNLVSQLVAVQDKRTGLVFTSAALCMNYLVQAPTAYIVGKNCKRVGFKNFLLLAHVLLPIRCTICALLAMYFPNRYALLATQIFDGMGGGIYDTVMPLVVQALTQGSGRFGFTYGFILTCWRLGHGLSVLTAESILSAAHERYEVPFFVLGGIGAVCTLLLYFGINVPPPLPEAACEKKKKSRIWLVVEVAEDDEDEDEDKVDEDEDKVDEDEVKEKQTAPNSSSADLVSMEETHNPIHTDKGPFVVYRVASV